MNMLVNDAQAFVTVVDIAGLISGAHKGCARIEAPGVFLVALARTSGEGLGNAFLSHIQSVEPMLHLEDSTGAD